MAKVLLILATVDTPQPATQTFGGKYLFKLGDTAQITDQTQFQFDDVVDGTYAASVQSLDATGAPIPDVVTTSVIVATPATGTPAPAPASGSYPAPSSLSATVTY